MKKFQFDDLWIVSRRERRGRGLVFHPRRTLLVGPNHTGKSTLIKLLFTTLGATPTGRLDRWDANAISAVRFTVDNLQYRVVHESGRRALFGENNVVLGVADSSAQWSALLASILDFNLTLTNAKSDKGSQADVGCYFLPFYIDQDSSWLGGWETFRSIKQFKSPVLPILEYFSGIRPPEYYRGKQLHDETQSRLAGLEKELGFLEKAQDRFRKRLPIVGPKMEEKNFQLEVARLTQQMIVLNAAQERLRSKAVQEADLIASLTRQIAIARDSVNEYERDKNYLNNRSSEPLICPVCSAEHRESFVDLLAFADDARSLNSIIIDLGAELERWTVRLRNTEAEIRQLDGSYREIEETLAIRRGDMEFREIVESRGAEHAFNAFENERIQFEVAISKLRSELVKHKTEMKRWSDPKKKKAVVDEFKSAYANALHELNMPKVEVRGLSSRPSVSGSGGPRAMLAYYSALWTVCLDHYGTFENPIVVDSPNQQAQDASNLERVLSYVSNQLPGNGQVILGSELDVDGNFDTRIALTTPYQVLADEEYDSAMAQLQDVLELMYKH